MNESDGSRREHQTTPANPIPRIESWLEVRGVPPAYPSEVTEITGLEATKIIWQGHGAMHLASEKGTRDRWWRWTLREGPERSFDHPDQLSQLLARFDHALEPLAEGVRTGKWDILVLLLSDVYDSLPEWCFSSDLIRKVVEIGADFQIEPIFIGRPPDSFHPGRVR